MTKILKSEKVSLYCEKHKQITEHMVYLKEDGKEIIRCLECVHEKPYAHQIYGRQSPQFKKPEQEKTTFGRIVA